MILRPVLLTARRRHSVAAQAQPDVPHIQPTVQASNPKKGQPSQLPPGPFKSGERGSCLISSQCRKGYRYCSIRMQHMGLSDATACPSEAPCQQLLTLSWTQTDKSWTLTGKTWECACSTLEAWSWLAKHPRCPQLFGSCLRHALAI